MANSLIAVWDLGGLGGGRNRFSRDSILDCPVRLSRRRPGAHYRDTRDKGWRSLSRSMRLWDFERMVAGMDRLFVDKVVRSRLLILDIDLHGEMDRDWAIKHGPGTADTDRARRELRRRWMAEWAAPALTAAMGVLGGEDALPLSSRGGYHVALLLDEALPVAELAALSARWARAVKARLGGLPAGMTIDSFPKLDADGTGRFCALPLGAGQRVIAPGIVKPVYGNKRLGDARRVASMGLSSVAAVRAQLEAVLGPESAEDLADPVGQCGGSAGWASGSLGQLWKSDYVVEALRIVMAGFGVGESADAAPRLLFALSAAGMRYPVALRAYEAFLRRPGHGANHCRSERGIRALMASARTQLRRFERGTRMSRPDGTPLTWYGGMKSDELRAELWGLVGQEAPPCRQPGLHAARIPATDTERFMA